MRKVEVITGCEAAVRIPAGATLAMGGIVGCTPPEALTAEVAA